MKRKLIPVLAMLLLLFVHCKKDKDETPKADLGEGLLAYFELNGGFDDSAKSLEVDYGGFLGFAKNRYGYAERAVYFNGGMMFFQTPWWRANPITISLWIKPKDLNTIGYLVSSQEEAFGVYQQQSKLSLIVATPDTVSAYAEIKNEWTHFAGTFDGKDIKTYINGKLLRTVRNPGVPNVTSLVNIGASPFSEWQGTLDDVRFYNRVLSAAEIKLLFEL
jgi:hypothetical protein